MARISIFSQLEAYNSTIKQNSWHWLLYVICRILLAFAFIVAGLVKISEERFANGLSELHPMGAYLEALHHTGYYYTFIGYAQVLAGIFLLIPQTVLVGALIYFPIIVNICILSFAVRFEGSFVSSPLMVLANLYILVWHYDKLKYILPFNSYSKAVTIPRPNKYKARFPVAFFIGVIFIMSFTVWLAHFGYQVMPRNSLKDCNSQFTNIENDLIGQEFCKCIHISGKPLRECLKILET